MATRSPRLARRLNAWRRRGGGPDPTAGLPFDPAALESRLVWILGSPRTGSTWLLEQLCDPLRVNASPPLGASLPRGQGASVDTLPVNEFGLGGHVAPAPAEPREIDGSYVAGTLNAAMSKIPGYLLSEEYADVWRPELRRLVLVRLHAHRERAARRFTLDEPLLIIKDVNSSYAADVFMPVFPRSRLIFLVRDGRDVVDSLVHGQGPGGWYSRLDGAAASFSTPEERVEWVRHLARRWMCDTEATERAYAAHAVERRRLVRYEDLRSETYDTLRSLVAWLGLERDDAWLRRIVSEHAFEAIPADRRGDLEKHRAAHPGLWRQNLTADEQRAADEIMGGKLEQLGYAR